MREELGYIHSRRPSIRGFEALYRHVYKIVLHKEEAKLYEKLAEFERKWIIENLLPDVRALAQDNISSSASEQLSERASELLKCISDQWKQFSISTAMIQDLFVVVDRIYAVDNRRAPINELLEESFRDNLLYHPMESPKSEARAIDLLFDMMFKLISLLRNGHFVDKKLIRSCVGLLKSLYGTRERTEDSDLYTIDFEPLFIADSKDFFVKETKSLLQQSASIWLQRTNYWLKEESELCRTVIWGPTYHAIIKVVESQLICGHLDHHATNFQAEIDTMFKNEDYENLQLLYQHIHRVDFRLHFLKKVFHSFIRDCVIDINGILDAPINPSRTSWLAEDVRGRNKEFDAVSSQKYLLEESHGISWALGILELERKVARNWEHGLDKDPILRIVQSESFSYFFKVYPENSRYLSLFLDYKIRRFVGSTSGVEFENLMDAVGLVQYILPVATFQSWYKEHISQRLVCYHSIPSLELEQIIIGRLRVEIGDGYADELERILEDAIYSQVLSQEFEKIMNSDQGTEQKNTVLSVLIVTNRFWPNSMVNWADYDPSGENQETLLYPSDLAELKVKFEDFHFSRTSRRLAWLRLAGKAEIDCSFPEVQEGKGHYIAARQYRFEVPTCFMIVMLLFNDLEIGTFLSFNDIEEKTKLPTWVLCKILTILSAVSETQILLMRPHITHDDYKNGYFFNESFTSKTEVVTIPVTLISSGCGKEDEIQKYNEGQTRLDTEGLQARIIRVMK